MARISLSDSEWEIMSIVWRKGKATVREVWQILYPDAEKAYTTVQTVMERLVKKGVLQKDKIGLVNFYSPVISKQEAAHQITRKLANRLFGGSFGSLAAYLIGSGDLTQEEIRLIKEMIQQKEKERKK